MLICYRRMTGFIGQRTIWTKMEKTNLPLIIWIQKEFKYIATGSEIPVGVTFPERLYVWDDRDGNVYWSKGKNRARGMPRAVFNGLMRKYVRHDCEDTDYEVYQYKGARIEGQGIAVPFETWADCMRAGKKPPRDPHAFKVRISYEGWKDYSILLWRVTFEYVAYRFKEHELWSRREAREKLKRRKRAAMRKRGVVFK